MAVETSLHTAIRSYRHVGVFICPSEFMATKMAEAHQYPDRMHVLRHFVDLSDTETKQAPGGEVMLGGRLVSEKAVDTAIRAIALVPGDARLHICGDGPMRPELERLAAEVAPERVVFHGRLPKDVLHEMLPRLVRVGHAVALVREPAARRPRVDGQRRAGRRHRPRRDPGADPPRASTGSSCRPTIRRRWRGH